MGSYDVTDSIIIPSAILSIQHAVAARILPKLERCCRQQSVARDIREIVSTISLAAATQAIFRTIKPNIEKASNSSAA